MGEMSKQDGIIEVLKKHEKIVDEWGSNAVFPPYINVSTEIEKLFEVEGKVKYIIQHRYKNRGSWADIHSDSDKTEIIETFRFLYKNVKDDMFTYHIIKRHTTDQIIEESHEKPA